MTTEYKEIIHDIVTNKITERAFTAKEIAEVEAAKAKALLIAEAEHEAQAAKAAAEAKLAALGLTPDDLKALGLGGN